MDVTADMEVAFVISICPQVNNPCNGFNPRPIRVVVRRRAGIVTRFAFRLVSQFECGNLAPMYSLRHAEDRQPYFPDIDGPD